ncbi:DUF4870 family protein [Desulfonatronovibrio magnus]|uniref:DUF4870 family protein n=1 Tax=Desulfonatronovibrio magnus TaxID=698827 RepID=UPI0005EAC8A8|nr:membrane protein [Desulfonatronovibrio magnus]
MGFEFPDQHNDIIAANKRVTTLIYALYAASIIFGVTIFIAIVMNYIKRSDVQGTFLESHFTWQIRTFWYSLMWSIIATVTAIIGVGFIIFIALFFWFIYRVAKGWLKLNENLPVEIR